MARIGEKPGGPVGTLYHGTSTALLESIRGHGLSPTPPGRVYADGHLAAGDGVYLTAERGWALKYSRDACARFGGEPVVVVVEADMSALCVDEDDLVHWLDEWEEFAGDAELDLGEFEESASYRKSCANAAARATISRFSLPARWTGRPAFIELYGLMMGELLKGGGGDCSQWAQAAWKKLGTDPRARALVMEVSGSIPGTSHDFGDEIQAQFRSAVPIGTCGPVRIVAFEGPDPGEPLEMAPRPRP